QRSTSAPGRPAASSACDSPVTGRVIVLLLPRCVAPGGALPTRAAAHSAPSAPSGYHSTAPGASLATPTPACYRSRHTVPARRGGMIWNPRAETLPRDQMQALQLERLRETVGVLLRAVPPQAERLHVAGIASAQDVSSLADLARLPFTRKAD